MSVKIFQSRATQSHYRQGQDAIRARSSTLILHLLKLCCFPSHPQANHWTAEVRNRLREMHRAQSGQPDYVQVISPLLHDVDLETLYKKLYRYGKPGKTQAEATWWIADKLLDLAESVVSGDPFIH